MTMEVGCATGVAIAIAIEVEVELALDPAAILPRPASMAMVQAAFVLGEAFEVVGVVESGLAGQVHYQEDWLVAC